MKKIDKNTKELDIVKNVPRNRIVLSVLLLAVVVFVGLGFLSYESFSTQDDSFSKMATSQQVINELEMLTNHMRSAEEKIVTYNGDWERDSIAYQMVSDNLDVLTSLLAHDKEQSLNITTLSHLLTSRLATLHQINGLGLAKGNPQAKMDTAYYRKLAFVLQETTSLESAKLTNYRNEAVRQQRNSFYLNLLSVVTAFLFGLGSFFIFMRDRTERKKVETNLTALNLNKDKFFSIISHDLRGPTSNILRLSEFLLEPNLADDERKKLTSHLHKSAQNLQKLLENLLSWAKFQMGRLEFIPAPVDLSILTNESIAQITMMASEKSIVIKNQVPVRTYVYADDQMVLMVFRNLLVNAIKFTNPGGTVRIYSKEVADQVQVSVEDTGIGMSPETTERLFQLKEHFTTLGTANEKGSGLGLILCMELLEKNNGSIGVVSEIGKGSTFTFTLPKLNASPGS